MSSDKEGEERLCVASAYLRAHHLQVLSDPAVVAFCVFVSLVLLSSHCVLHRLDRNTKAMSQNIIVWGGVLKYAWLQEGGQEY